MEVIVTYLLPLIVVSFVSGYMFIALEGVVKINKAAIALMTCAICWTLYAIGSNDNVSLVVQDNLGEVASTVFFLMGAMTIVAVVDSYGGFAFVGRIMRTDSKRRLMWKMGIATFMLSAVLDNLTTSIVMITVLHWLINERNDRLWYAAMIIIAANAGGAFSPIGDVTTIMLWNGGMISASGAIRSLFVPSLLAFVCPCLLMQFHLRGPLKPTYDELIDEDADNGWQRFIVMIVGIGGLCCVPVFHYVTGLPPFVGVLTTLAVLWIVTEVMCWNGNEEKMRSRRVATLLSQIDFATILFFLGILMSVAVLSETGVLSVVGLWLADTIGNSYLTTGAIGLVSAMIDNVPLVAGTMKMYAITGAGDMAVDGVFWQLLAYCVGTGGSILIIGSAAGVVVMGLERVCFGWYLRRITPIAILGYLLGIIVYWLVV